MFLTTIKKIFISIVLCLAAFFLITLTGAVRFYEWSSYLVDSALIKNLLTDVVEEQTGGKLQLDKVRFDPLKGLLIEGFEFFPPDPLNPVGYRYSGAVTKQALFTMKKLDFDYSLLRIFLTELRLNKAQLISPHLHLLTIDSVPNYDGILKYRQKHFPSQEAEEEPKKEEVPAEPFVVPAIAANVLQYIYLPIFEVIVGKVGIEGLGFSLLEMSEGKKSKEMQLNGLNLNLSASWKRAQTALKMSAGSSESPLKVFFWQKNKKDLTNPNIFSVELNLKNEFVIQNIRQINFDMSIHIRNVLLSVIPPEKLALINQNLESSFRIKTKLRTEIKKDFRGINLDQLAFSIADSLQYKLSGAIGLKGGRVDLIDLDLAQFLLVDLNKLMKMLRPLAAGDADLSSVSASGRMLMKELKISGLLDLSKDNSKDNLDVLPKSIPQVNLSAAIDQLRVSAPFIGLSVLPIDGEITLATEKSTGNENLRIQNLIDIRLSGVDLTTKTDVGPVAASLEGFRFLFNGEASYPSMVATINKLDVTAKHLSISGERIKKIDFPFSLHVEAGTSENIAKAQASYLFDFGKIITASGSLECEELCRKIKIKLLNSMPDLAKVHKIAFPVAASFGFNRHFPETLTGKIESQIDVYAEIPKEKEITPEFFLKRGKLDFSVEAKVKDLDLEIPSDRISVTGYYADISFAGDLKNQKIINNVGFKQVKVVLPQKKEVESEGSEEIKLSPPEISLKNLKVTNTIHNNLGPSFHPSAAGFKDLVSLLSIDMNLASIESEQILPEPLKNISFNLQANQNQLKLAELSSLRFEAPSLGLALHSKAKVGLDENFFPQTLKSSFNFVAEPSKSKSLAEFVEAEGRLMSEGSLESKDMKKLVIQGTSSFDEFSLSVLSKDEAKPYLAEVEEINGEVSLYQSLNIEKIIANIKKEQKTKASNTDLSSVVANESEVSGESNEEQPPEFFHYIARLWEGINRDRDVNQIALVDYPAVKPFYPSKKPIKIKRISAAGLDITNLEFDAEMRQDVFAVNQFAMNFLGGKIQGDFQFLIDSNAERPIDILNSVKTSLHVTRLNTHKLIEKIPRLKNKKGFRLLGSNPFIDAMVHLRYDFLNGDLAGGIEIPTIGKEQLKMMLYFIDPMEKDPTISKIQMALNFGEVRLVSIPIKNGEIGMNLDIRLLAVPLPVPSLSNIPLAKIAKNFAAAGPKATGEIAKNKDANATNAEQTDLEQIKLNDEFLKEKPLLYGL